MRIISQDGKLDFPYEHSVVFISLVDASEIRIVAIGDYDNVVIAKYSTEEKAKKAMEMLRNKYTQYISTNYLKIFQFPAEEELE